MVPAQSVLPDLIRSGMKVRDCNPAVVPAFAADDLGAGEGIDSPESGLECQGAVNPTRLQFRGGVTGAAGVQPSL